MIRLKFCLKILFVVAWNFIQTQSSAQNIRINQLGFYPLAPKIAVVIGDTTGGTFYIISIPARDTVFKGLLGAAKQSANSSLKTRIADFSALQKKGTYLIMLPGKDSSYTFNIQNKLHHDVGVASLKGFYYQRSAMPLEKKYAGKWARGAGHPDTAVFIHPSAASPENPAMTKISCTGGWYDAGDYNKYIVNSGISMGTLLSAYEDFPGYFDTLNTNIPESGDAIPDILNEILYNLRWMLTMQDTVDGGVYNKCTNAAFDGMVMPGVTKLPRWVVQKGTAATLDFAAVTAQASRILIKWKKQLPGLGDSCLAAAVKAWKWAGKNPALQYDQNRINALFDPKITTGAYGDKNFDDEWFWAASELYCTTRDETYFTIITGKINSNASLPSWGNVFNLGCYTLARNQKRMTKDHTKEIQSIQQKLVQFADPYLQHVEDNAFQTVMGNSKRDFIWGSNAVAANQSVALINAYLITHDKKYINYALTNLDYILGRNATGYCFITGIGSKSTMHPHHRPSVADGIAEPVPGLMAGGPNPGMQDHCHYDFFEPETAYVDTDCAYASNEIAINWNAPFVYLANAIEALQFEIGFSRKAATNSP